ncbi:MAG TPA: hAT transposon family protein, partial [Chlamydiales bacterium]|nr:hAT transposon family protein [Chlamydiales bacterium]
VLDPRINYCRLIQYYKAEPDIINEIEIRKKELLEYYSTYYAGKASPSQDPNTLSSVPNSDPDGTQHNFMARYDDEEEEDDTHNELEDFFLLPPEKFRNCDPFDWWRHRKTRFPNLCCLARDVLSIPGKWPLDDVYRFQTGFVSRFRCGSGKKSLGRARHYLPSSSGPETGYYPHSNACEAKSEARARGLS